MMANKFEKNAGFTPFVVYLEMINNLLDGHLYDVRFNRAFFLNYSVLWKYVENMKHILLVNLVPSQYGSLMHGRSIPFLL